MKTYEIPITRDAFYETNEIYKKINYYGYELNHYDKRRLAEKFKLLKRFIEKPLKALSHDIGIDLMKALEYRFKNPKYEESTDSEFDLEQFAIKPKVKANTNVNVTTLVQLPLTAFT